MGICPNCGSWVDEGDICHGCGGSGSYSFQDDEEEQYYPPVENRMREYNTLQYKIFSRNRQAQAEKKLKNKEFLIK